jgi:hypothetical protein
MSGKGPSRETDPVEARVAILQAVFASLRILFYSAIASWHSRTDQLLNIHGGDYVSSEDSSEGSSESMVGVQLGG